MMFFLQQKMTTKDVSPDPLCRGSIEPRPLTCEAAPGDRRRHQDVLAAAVHGAVLDDFALGEAVRPDLGVFAELWARGERSRPSRPVCPAQVSDAARYSPARRAGGEEPRGGVGSGCAPPRTRPRTPAAPTPRRGFRSAAPPSAAWSTPETRWRRYGVNKMARYDVDKMASL